MSGSVSLAYKLFGEDVSASKTIEGVGRKAGGLGKSFSQMGKIAGGALAGIGLASLGRDAIQFGKDSMDAFSTTGSQVLALQRVAGGTAEQMSHLAAAAAMTGTDTDVLQKSIGLLAKNMAGPGAKSFSAMGIATKDSQGHLRSFADVMPQLADRFAKMPAGADKTALALKLFGKQGLAMLPILNKGSAGLAEISKASDEAGTTLGGKDLDAVKANNKAKREFAETVKGLQIAIGRDLYPVITKLMNFFKTSVLPGIKAASAFFIEHQDVLLKVAAVIAVVAAGVSVFGKALSLVSGIVRIFTAVQAALNFVMAANPIVLVVLAVVALIAILVLAYHKVGWFRAFVDGAMRGISAAFGWVVQAAKNIWNWIKGNWPLLLAILTGPFGLAVKFIHDHWDTIVGFVKGLPGRIATAASGMWDGIKDAFRGAINWIIRAWNDFQIQFPSFSFDWNGPLPGGETTVGGWTVDTPNLPLLAAGGTAVRGGWARVGERGPENVFLPTGASVVPLGGGGGPTYNVFMAGAHIYGPGSGKWMLSEIEGAISGNTARPNVLKVR